MSKIRIPGFKHSSWRRAIWVRRRWRAPIEWQDVDAATRCRKEDGNTLDPRWLASIGPEGLRFARRHIINESGALFRAKILPPA